MVAVPIATVVGEVIVTHTAVEGVALAATEAPPAPHHLLGVVAATTTAHQLEDVIHMCQATDGLRDAGHPRWTQPRVDLARDHPVQEAVEDPGDATPRLHTCARDPDRQFLGKITTGLAGARPPQAETRLPQSDGAIPHPGAAHLSDGDTAGRGPRPGPTDDRYHDRGARHHAGDDVTGTAGVEVLRPVVLVEVRAEGDAH